MKEEIAVHGRSSLAWGLLLLAWSSPWLYSSALLVPTDERGSVVAPGRVEIGVVSSPEGDRAEYRMEYTVANPGRWRLVLPLPRGTVVRRTSLETARGVAPLTVVDPKSAASLARTLLIVESPQVVVGRLRSGSEKGRLLLRAQTPGGAESVEVSLAPGASSPQNDFVARLWANRRLGWEQQQVARYGLDDKRVKTIGQLAREYALPTELSLALGRYPNEQERKRLAAEHKTARGEERERLAEMLALGPHVIVQWGKDVLEVCPKESE